VKPQPLSQREVDQIRLNVLSSWLVRKCKTEDYTKQVRHLRFPENRTTKYMRRDGNPPSDTDRNPWERGLRLELDLGEIPESVRKAVADLRTLHTDRDLNEESMKQIRLILIALVAKHLKNVMGTEFQGEAMSSQDLIDHQMWEEAEVKRRFKEKVAEEKRKSSVKAFRKFPQFLHHERDKYRP
jgi:hypothetical protein